MPASGTPARPRAARARSSLTRSARWRARGVNLLVLAVSFLVTCLVLEGVMRRLAPQPLGLRYFARDGLMVHFPGAKVRCVRSEYDAIVRIDSDGLRDRDYPEGKPPGVFRVLVLGDSFTDGLQVEDDEVWVKLVERELAALSGGRPIEMVNAGLAGAGTADELRYLMMRGERWKPDLVLVAFYCGNDVRDNLSDDRVKFDGAKLEVGFRKPFSRSNHAARTVRYWLASHSHLYQFVRDRFKPSGWLKSGLESAGLREAKGEDEEGWGEFDDKQVLEVPPPARIAAGWEVTRALLDRLDETSRGLGARMAVTVFPTRWMLDEALLREKDVRDGISGRGEIDPSLPGRTVCSWADSRGVPCLDLFGRLRDRGEGPALYFQTDAHWTPAGHRTAASEIAPWLAAVVDVRRAKGPA